MELRQMISMCTLHFWLVLWVSFWYIQLHQKCLSVSIRFVWEDLVALWYILQPCSVWNQLCLLLSRNLVLFQTTYEPLLDHFEVYVFMVHTFRVIKLFSWDSSGTLIIMICLRKFEFKCYVSHTRVTGKISNFWRNDISASVF